jgi:hypothetical protein
MESLAIIVVTLFLVAFVAGPLSIALSSGWIQSRFGTKTSIGMVLLDVLRKVVHIILVALGTLVGVQFLVITGLPIFPRLIGLLSIITCYIGLRREYFPEFFILRVLKAKFGGSRKNGRSSGNDGNGPAGQH